MSVVGAILAAGSSSRLGRPKQLVPVAGEPLLRRTARLALATSCTATAVVVGAHAGEVTPAVAGLAVTTLVNEAWPEGVASSIRAATMWAEAQSASALLLMVCDQPRLTTEHLAALLAEHARTGAVVGSAYRGTVGVPAVFPASSFAALGALHGDRGARALLAGAAAISWDDGAVDVDSEADVDALR
ncbi:MAG: nucleotidyltransferase family protein [Polyangiales bacterium]